MSSPIEFTLLESASQRTLVRLGISGETAAGLHVVSLADHGIVLDPGVLYEWWVSLILENGPTATIPRSGGAIVRLELAAAKLADPSGSRTPERWHANAREGLWYESFDFIASLGERHPESKPLIALRSALLAEVGLGDSE